MSVILEDTAGKSIEINAWNWGVLHYAIACAKSPVFEDEEWLEALRYGGGVTLSKAQTEHLLIYLAKVVLARIKPGQRMLADLGVTDEPDAGTFYRDDLAKNYSLHYEVLVTVLEFLREAQPPIQVF